MKPQSRMQSEMLRRLNAHPKKQNTPEQRSRLRIAVMELLASGRERTVSEIAERLNSNSQAIGGAVASLKKKGLNIDCGSITNGNNTIRTYQLRLEGHHTAPKGITTAMGQGQERQVGRSVGGCLGIDRQARHGAKNQGLRNHPYTIKSKPRCSMSIQNFTKEQRAIARADIVKLMRDGRERTIGDIQRDLGFRPHTTRVLIKNIREMNVAEIKEDSICGIKMYKFLGCAK